MKSYSLVFSSNPHNKIREIESHHLDEHELDQTLKACSEDTSLDKDIVSDSLSEFLDETNVSMMGGWT